MEKLKSVYKKSQFRGWKSGKTSGTVLKQTGWLENRLFARFWKIGRVSPLDNYGGARVSSPAAASPDLTPWDFLDADWTVQPLRLGQPPSPIQNP